MPSINHETSVDTKTDKYHSILENIIERLAPHRKKRLPQENKQSWYDEQVTNEVRLKCMKKRKCKDSRNVYFALQYQKMYVRKVIHAKQKQYYHDLFNNISRYFKRLYAVANKLLFRKQVLPLPEEKNSKILPERLNKFLHERLKRSWLAWCQLKLTPLTNPT